MISRYSIAVLPFVNMSSDQENEYFTDGITEEILNALSKIEGLHVTARTSSFAFKNQQIDIREIGKRLNVALLLEGSIRKSGNKVRITAQLTRADNGFHVWSDSWDRELTDILILQDEIASLIAEKVNRNITTEPHTSGHPVQNTEALDAYLRANYLLKTWDFSQGTNMLALFKKAIELDPGLIKAYIGLSDASTWLGATGNLPPEEAQQNVEYCIRKVLELDPDSPDIHMILASKHFWMEWDIHSALNSVNKALELKPSFPDALMYKGILLAAAGKVEEAFDHLFQADRLDPYAKQINSGIGMIYFYINEDEKALEYLEKNIKIAPYWDAQYMFKVQSLCKLKRFDEALATIDEIAGNPNSPLVIAELMAYYYACRGKRDEAYAEMEIMKKGSLTKQKPGNPDPAFYAQIHLVLGEYDQALDYLEEGVKAGSSPFLFNKVDSHWDMVRDHHRYIEAMSRIRYPEFDSAPFRNRKKYSKSGLSEEDSNAFQDKLQAYMQKEKPWLNPTLTLSDLAESIDITTHQLSQLLNEHIGENFYDYVNSFRLEYFLRQMQESRSRKYTLLSVAYDCGFNSKTTFNTYFKKIKGKSPSEYFRKQ